jgi:hypothetical protein
VLKNNFLLIFSFGQVNYVCYKLFGNTKHVQFKLCMSPWKFFVQNGFKIHFSCIFKGAPKNCQKVEEHGAKKEVCIAHRILVFHFKK